MRFETADTNSFQYTLFHEQVHLKSNFFNYSDSCLEANIQYSFKRTVCWGLQRVGRWGRRGERWGGGGGGEWLKPHIKVGLSG